MAKLSTILDTSPLITICSFQVSGQLIVEHILAVASITVVETVRQEGTANPGYEDAQVIQRLLDAKQIKQLPVSQHRLSQAIDGYAKLGQGERDTIRLGLTRPRSRPVFDDYLAFVIASRFGLKPLLFLDLLVLLVEKGGLTRSVALDIANGTATRYSKPFIDHTLQKLGEVKI